MKAQQENQWRGFCVDHFVVEGRHCKMVVPPEPNVSRRWVWKPEFFGAFSRVDEELVRLGFYLIYADNVDQYGCPEAIRFGNAVYDFFTKRQKLNPKVTFLALSRAGLFAYNWTAANPDKVCAIYADNPVCDIKSWPGGLGVGPGSADDWQKCLKAYRMHENDAIRYPHNPVDLLENIARAQIPILHVIGDADEIVPVSENSERVKRQMQSLNGRYQEIIRPGAKHHPHGLNDPQPILDFILTTAPATNQLQEPSLT